MTANTTWTVLKMKYHVAPQRKRIATARNASPMIAVGSIELCRSAASVVVSWTLIRREPNAPRRPLSQRRDPRPPRRCRGSRSRRASCCSAPFPRARISDRPSSSRSHPSSRACGSRSRIVRRTSCVIGTRFRRPVTRSITGACSPCRAASHLFSVVRTRWKLGAVPVASTCSDSILTSDWKYAVSATTSSTRVTASQMRSSIVPRRGCGRMSHQMWV